MNLRNSPFIVAALLFGVGCHPWANLPDNGTYDMDADLWSQNLVAAKDGLYVHLPHAGELVRVSTDGTWAPVDLNGAEPVSMQLAPDQETVLVFSRWLSCDTDEPDVDKVSECDDEFQVWNNELNLVRGGAVVQAQEIPGFFNEVAFSPIDPNGAYDPVAVAYLDYAAAGTVDITGVANLDAVMFIDLVDSSILPPIVNVGFSPSNVLFTSDASKAVVLSRSQAAVVDLTGDEYATLVTYNLTLDPDQEVDPVGAAITPDNQYLLISVKNSGDLYALDLESESINIVDLDAAPTAMSVDATADRTALVFGSTAEVAILEHELFDITMETLDEPCNAITSVGDGQVLLYNTKANTHDIYRLDLANDDLVEYVVANPVNSLQVAPGGYFATAIIRQEWSGQSGADALYDQYYGLAILDMLSNDLTHLWLEAEPVGFAYSVNPSSGMVSALVLLNGLDDLYLVGVADGRTTIVKMPAAANGIGSMPDGGFYITHDAALGLVSFLDPATGEIVSQASGFAIDNVLPADEPLPRMADESAN